MEFESKIKMILELLVVYSVAFWLGCASLFVLAWKGIKNGFEVFKVKERTVPPPILSDKRWGMHQYITLKNQGIKLHYVEKGDKDKPLLLCLHGFPECWFSWRHQLEEFSSQFWVVALDMRGYGDSDKPGSRSDYKLDILVEDIRQFILELGQTKCSLVAHDWGAVIAWKLVEAHPNLFQRHISISGPHPVAYRQILRSSFTQLRKAWYVFFFQCPFLPEIFLSLNDFKILEEVFRGPKNLVEAFPDDVIEAYKYYCCKEGKLKFPINYYRCSLLNQLSTEEQKKITVPTLIIWGTEDGGLSKDIPKAMVKLCSDVQLKMVEGAGHYLHEEEQSHVNKLMWDYIKITN